MLVYIPAVNWSSKEEKGAEFKIHGRNNPKIAFGQAHFQIIILKKAV